LGGVTQVVWAEEEGHLLHNRLTHSLKVAQVGRRLAETFQRGHNVDEKVRFDDFGGLDPDVVEAACLAHDLGHPPFGHAAEDVLQECAEKSGAQDGFEGNAQSFRIVTRLAVLREDKQGLDLSRATLNAILKYPWRSREKALGGGKKFGVYDDDLDWYEWARAHMGLRKGRRSLEAELMDWADDITYAVHDVEDFYRAGLIPTSRLGRPGDQDMPALANLVRKHWEPKFGTLPTDSDLEKGAGVAFAMLPSVEPFRGTRSGRSALKQGTSALIQRFTKGTRLTRRGLELDYSVGLEVSLLKQLTRHFVIRDAALSTQQVGQKRIVRELFSAYLDALAREDFGIFPASATEEARRVVEHGRTRGQQVRFVVDIVAGMTEKQAIKVHRRLTGVDFGSFLDPAVG
jgi:dGTPase